MIQTKNLDDAGLRKLQDLEQKLGCCIVALEPLPQPAPLSEKQLEELQTEEKKMGTILIAYRCKTPGG